MKTKKVYPQQQFTQEYVMKSSIRSKVNFDEFRKDILNNVEFKVFKSKYGIKTYIELEGMIYRLSKFDKKIYDYKFQDIVRSQPVYESKDGFVKISRREVKKIKSQVKCEKLEFGGVKFENNQIIIDVKVA
jgi:hypothetical protein